MDRCVVCYNPIRTRRKQSLVDQQLSVFFFLGKFFNFEDEEGFINVQELLRSDGNPSSWIKFCVPCSAWVEDGKSIYKEITQLQKGLEEIRGRVESTIRTSWDANQGHQRNGRTICDTIRSKIVNVRGKRKETPHGWSFLQDLEPHPHEVKTEYDSNDEGGNEDSMFGEDFFPSSLEEELNQEGGDWELIRDVDMQNGVQDGDHENHKSVRGDGDQDFQLPSRKRFGAGSRKRSIVNQYFEELEDVWRCNLCGIRFRRPINPKEKSTWGRLQHLRSKHSEILPASETRVKQNETLENTSISDLDNENSFDMTGDIQKRDGQDCHPETEIPAEDGARRRTKAKPKPSLANIYFDELEEERLWQCKLCPKKYPMQPGGNTSHRLRHLKTQHREVLSAFLPLNPGDTAIEVAASSKSAETEQNTACLYTECGGTVVSGSVSVNEHIREKQGYTCYKCDRSYGAKKHLVDHEFTHLTHEERLQKFSAMGDEAVKSRTCPVCSEIFLRPSLLGRHLRIHQDKIDASCPIAATTSTVCKTCEICGRGFKIRRAYIDHIKLHLSMMKDENIVEMYQAGEELLLQIRKDENGRIIEIQPATIDTAMSSENSMNLIKLVLDS